MKNIISIIVLLIFFSGCKKVNDGSADINEIIEAGVLKDVYHNGIIDRHYSYNGDNWIDTCYYYNDDGNFSNYRLYEYPGDTIIEKIFNSNNQITYSYTYYKTADNILRRDRQKFIGTPLFTYILYHSSGNPCGFDLGERFDSDDVLMSYTNYTFLPENCGNYNTSIEANGDLIGIFESKRDNQNSYSRSARNLLFYPNSMGNITQHSRWWSEDVIDVNGSYESEFTYNSDSYPTSEVRTYLSGQVLYLDYIYY